MENQFTKDAKALAFHLNNLAIDFEKSGQTFTASDLRQASLTIKILLNNMKMKVWDHE